MSYIYIYIYAFSRRFYPKRLTFHSSFYILSALAFPGNRTHDLGIASAMLYQLSYRKAVDGQNKQSDIIVLYKAQGYHIDGCYISGHLIQLYVSNNKDIFFETAYSTFNGDMDHSLKSHLTVTGSYGTHLQLCLR